MKRHGLLIGVLSIAAVLMIPSQQVQARTEVECLFTWHDDVGTNVKGGRLTTETKVRNKEYQRLVGAGRVNARASAEGGNKCQLNHPENATIDVSIDRQAYRLNTRQRLPSCGEMRATVSCWGK